MIVEQYITLSPEICEFFFILRKKRLRFYSHIFLKLDRGIKGSRTAFRGIQGSRTAFYLSYLHSRTTYIVSLERAWKDNSNHTLYSK